MPTTPLQNYVKSLTDNIAWRYNRLRTILGTGSESSNPQLLSGSLEWQVNRIFGRTGKTPDTQYPTGLTSAIDVEFMQSRLLSATADEGRVSFYDIERVLSLDSARRKHPLALLFSSEIAAIAQYLSRVRLADGTFASHSFDTIAYSDGAFGNRFWYRPEFALLARLNGYTISGRNVRPISETGWPGNIAQINMPSTLEGAAQTGLGASNFIVLPAASYVGPSAVHQWTGLQMQLVCPTITGLQTNRPTITVYFKDESGTMNNTGLTATIESNQPVDFPAPDANNKILWSFEKNTDSQSVGYGFYAVFTRNDAGNGTACNGKTFYIKFKNVGAPTGA